MFNSRKFAIACLTLLLLVLAACGGGNKKEPGSNLSSNNSGSSGNGASSDGDTASGSSEEKEITITYWVDPRFQFVKGLEDQTKDFGDWEKLQAEEFMKLHPNVKIEVQALTWDDLGKKVPASIAAGTQPDILRDYLGRTAMYAQQGVLENLEELVPKEELDDYIPGYLEQYTINGHLHALPSYAWAAGLVVNKQLWKEVGQEHLLPTPDDPYWTIEEFEQALNAIKQGDNVPFVINVATSQGDTALLSLFFSFGAQFFKDGDYSKTALNSPEAAQALEFLAKLNDAKMLQPGAVSMQPGDIDNLFFTGKVGAYGNTLGLFSLVENAKKDGKTNAEFDLMLVHMPSANGVEQGVIVGPTGLAIFKQKDEYKRKMVAEFAMFLNNTEYQKQYAINAGQFPVKKSAGVPLEDDPNYKTLQKIINERGVEDMGLTHPKFAEFRPLLQPEVQAVLLKSKTPEAALKSYEEAVNKILTAN